MLEITFYGESFLGKARAVSFCCVRELTEGQPAVGSSEHRIPSGWI